MGVFVCISPWNFPLAIFTGQVAAALAAGNVVIAKPAESTSLIMINEHFDETEISVFTGDPEVGAFSSLPFDHLLFTGATSIAKHVMRAASENLVPVTLELGGKSPVVIGKDTKIKEAAARVMQGKTMNAGQICLAPDYVLVHKHKKDEFIYAVKEFYPSIKDNDDYTSIINERHFDRINALISDAKEKGADINQINPSNEDFSQQEFYKIPPTVITNTTEDMNVMHEEIFGPVLPVVTYENINEALALINSKDRPLGLYYFGYNKDEEANILNNTSSGGVTINNVIGHIQQKDLPFGGVGPSGIGRYHSLDGFKNFSNQRAVFKDVGFKSYEASWTSPSLQKEGRKAVCLNLFKAL